MVFWPQVYLITYLFFLLKGEEKEKMLEMNQIFVVKMPLGILFLI